MSTEYLWDTRTRISLVWESLTVISTPYYRTYDTPYYRTEYYRVINNSNPLVIWFHVEG